MYGWVWAWNVCVQLFLSHFTILMLERSLWLFKYQGINAHWHDFDCNMDEGDADWLKQLNAASLEKCLKWHLLNIEHGCLTLELFQCQNKSKFKDIHVSHFHYQHITDGYTSIRVLGTLHKLAEAIKSNWAETLSREDEHHIKDRRGKILCGNRVSSSTALRWALLQTKMADLSKSSPQMHYPWMHVSGCIKNQRLCCTSG